MANPKWLNDNAFFIAESRQIITEDVCSGLSSYKVQEPALNYIKSGIEDEVWWPIRVGIIRATQT